MKYRLKRYVDGNGDFVWRLQHRHKWWPLWSNFTFFNSPWSYSYQEWRCEQEAIRSLEAIIKAEEEEVKRALRKPA